MTNGHQCSPYVPWIPCQEEIEGLADNAFPSTDTFQCARASLTLATNDSEFRSRFRRLFGECLDESGFSKPREGLCFELRSLSQASVLSSNQALPPEPLSFLAAVSLERKFQDAGECAGWQLLSDCSMGGQAIVAARDGQLVFAHRGAWQACAAQFIVGDWIRIQESTLFFHAATAAIGQAGILLAGPKGSGKTTLALTLASRGHAFLSDEFASVCAETRTVFPFRRMVSIRRGPQTSSVHQFIEDNGLQEELLADGSPRFRVSVSEMFPLASAKPIHLSHVFILEDRRGRPACSPAHIGLERAPLIQPLPATLWTEPKNRRVFKILRLLAGSKCYYLTPGGSPDETADLIEKTVEDSCH